MPPIAAPVKTQPVEPISRDRDDQESPAAAR
jgi:hypothetical protein